MSMDILATDLFSSTKTDTSLIKLVYPSRKTTAYDLKKIYPYIRPASDL